MVLAVHSVRQSPSAPDATLPTWMVRLGYALPDQLAMLERMRRGRTSNQVVPVEISVNDAIVHHTSVSLGADVPDLRISTLEDIVGEKLRALLQQPIRNRERRQDLLDLAVVRHHGTDLDLAMVAEALQLKSEARDISPRRALFRDLEVMRRARIDYAQLQDTTRTLFIPFDDAWDILMALIDEMPIPE